MTRCIWRRYEDGDEEDLELEELQPLLCDAAGSSPGSMRRTVSPPAERVAAGRWEEWLVGSPIQYKLPFAEGKKREKHWMWLRGVVKRTCKSHANWVHVQFDDTSSLDVQVVPAGRGDIWVLEPELPPRPVSAV